jgi:hypothetical protein
MSKKRNIYKEFFGIQEQMNNNDQSAYQKTLIQKLMKDPKQVVNVTDDMNEAELINNITDYRGGVQYMLRDAAMAENVANEIKQFATKKKIYIVKHTKSRSGKGGYFYFRLGEDPAKESQQLQGYLSQKPEIKYFRFKVMPEQQPRQNRNI